MNSNAITETVGLIARVAAMLSAVAPTTDADLAANVRQAIGDLVDRAELHMRSKTMGDALRAAFDAVAAAGTSLEGMDRVRGAAVAEGPSTVPGLAAKTICIRFSLIGMARALSATTFRSREDVEAASARVSDGFAPAIDAAADAGDNEAYRDFVALHAAAIRDLNQRSRPLPRIVSYSFARVLPTLAISQRLYGAGDRADEIAAENKVIHPLFAPAQGRALSI